MQWGRGSEARNIEVGRYRHKYVLGRDVPSEVDAGR